MPVMESSHKISAYTIEVAGTPTATIKATSLTDAMRYIADGFEDLTAHGWWDGEEPITIRNATLLEKDELQRELKRPHRVGIDSNDPHFVYWQTREMTVCEKDAYKARQHITAL